MNSSQRDKVSVATNSQSKVAAPLKVRVPRVFQTLQKRHAHPFFTETKCVSGENPSGRSKENFGNNGDAEPTNLNCGPHSREQLDEWKSEDGRDCEIEFYNPHCVGTYPPRSADLLLFQKDRLYSQKTLEDLDEDEDMQAQPEKELQSAAIKPLPVLNRKIAFSLPLDLFDNPDMDLHHPAIDIAEAHRHGERGVLGRSRYYTTDGKSSWKACLVLEYNPETCSYLVEWLDNKKQKIVKRPRLRLFGE